MKDRHKYVDEDEQRVLAKLEALSCKSRSAGSLTGLVQYLPPDDRREDLFEPSHGIGMGFPCCACKHSMRPASECLGCAHYSA